MHCVSIICFISASFSTVGFIFSAIKSSSRCSKLFDNFTSIPFRYSFPEKGGINVSFPFRLIRNGRNVSTLFVNVSLSTTPQSFLGNLHSILSRSERIDLGEESLTITENFCSNRVCLPVYINSFFWNSIK